MRNSLTSLLLTGSMIINSSHLSHADIPRESATPRIPLNSDSKKTMPQTKSQPDRPSASLALYILQQGAVKPISESMWFNRYSDLNKNFRFDEPWKTVVPQGSQTDFYNDSVIFLFVRGREYLGHKVRIDFIEDKERIVGNRVYSGISIFNQEFDLSAHSQSFDDDFVLHLSSFSVPFFVNRVRSNSLPLTTEGKVNYIFRTYFDDNPLHSQEYRVTIDHDCAAPVIGSKLQQTPYSPDSERIK